MNCSPTAFIAAFALVAAAPASGAAVDGNMVLPGCRLAAEGGTPANASEGFGVGLCIGVIEGVRGVNSAIKTKLPEGSGICFPAGVTNQQLAKVLVKALQDDPANLHVSASVLTLIAFSYAYGCSRTIEEQE